MMFNTYTLSANSRYSPGLILIRNIVDHYAGRGFTSLDLGIGADDYKLLFCKQREPVLDNFIALSAGGQVAHRHLDLWQALREALAPPDARGAVAAADRAPGLTPARSSILKRPPCPRLRRRA